MLNEKLVEIKGSRCSKVAVHPHGFAFWLVQSDCCLSFLKRVEIPQKILRSRENDLRVFYVKPETKSLMIPPFLSSQFLIDFQTLSRHISIIQTSLGFNDRNNKLKLAALF